MRQETKLKREVKKVFGDLFAVSENDRYCFQHVIKNDGDGRFVDFQLIAETRLGGLGSHHLEWDWKLVYFDDFFPDNDATIGTFSTLEEAFTAFVVFKLEREV